MTDRKYVSLARIALSCVVAAWITLVPSTVFPQAGSAADETVAEGEGGVVEQVVVTGTRKTGLVPTETLSPVDVLPNELLINQASFDLTDGITRIAPSFNTQRFPIADGTAFIRPVTLRNLSPDHTLVLVNGTRRHRSALVNLQLAPLGTVNQGSQAVDFSNFPAAAIQRVEVLRDGASAQYGSDAIAGVVNVILKDDPKAASVYVQSGKYYDGDGTRVTAGGNGGLPLSDKGFVTGAFEYSTSDETSRGVARPDAEFVSSVVGKDQTPLDGLGQRWGDPDVEVWKVFANAGYDVSDRAQIYAHGSYAKNETISDFFYRGPVLPPANSFDARTTLQQDNDGDFCPDPAPQSLIDEIVAAGLDPDDYLIPNSMLEAECPASPSGYVLRNPAYTRFPGGYNPNFGADLTDYGVVLGGKGATGAGLTWDVRGRLAENKIEYVISETINPSLGGLSPDSFTPGTLTQQEVSVNADLVKPFDTGALASPLNTAIGVEYRDETYRIGAGDAASIEAGPTAAIFGVGSDGFQGFPTESSGDFSSTSFAGYLDLEADVIDRVSAGLALRFEDYDEFGSTFDWKGSGRWQVTSGFALRGTANSGFRAPTPGQVNTLNVTTSADASGNLIPSGVYPVDHPVAKALGSVALDPEESLSYTVGLVTAPTRNTSITLDYYWIEIKDRLALQNNTITEADTTALQDAGVENADLLVGSIANFFSNAYDSRVWGLDLAVTTNVEMDSGLLTVDFRHNFNAQSVPTVAPGTINASRVFDLENQVPDTRSNLTVSYDTRKIFSGYARANLYGSWQSTGGLFSPGDASDVSSYGADILVDVEAKARIAHHYEVAVGADNVFDRKPDGEGDEVLRFLGVDHSLTSPYGFNGAIWYVRAAARF